MSTGWKRLRHRFEYAGVWLALSLTRILPLTWMRGVGAGLGRLAWSAFRIRRDVAVDNISRSLGVGDVEAARIGRESYANLGRSLMEYSAFAKLDASDVRRLMRFSGAEHFDRALELGRGAVLFTGHFGNWELMGAGAVAHGYPIHFLVGEQTNHRVDELMNNLRRRQGIGIISRNVALKKVLRTLRANEFVALLGDQDARKGGVFVDFLGRAASTVKGPAMFACRQRCPVIPGFIRRGPDGIHEAVLEPAVWPRDDLEGEAAVEELTARITGILADYIRRYPTEYFWAHRRWKTRPPEETDQQPVGGGS